VRRACLVYMRYALTFFICSITAASVTTAPFDVSYHRTTLTQVDSPFFDPTTHTRNCASCIIALRQETTGRLSIFKLCFIFAYRRVFPCVVYGIRTYAAILWRFQSSHQPRRHAGFIHHLSTSPTHLRICLGMHVISPIFFIRTPDNSARHCSGQCRRNSISAQGEEAPVRNIPIPLRLD
jgi:hypothetical protein